MNLEDRALSSKSSLFKVLVTVKVKSCLTLEEHVGKLDKCCLCANILSDW